MLKDEVNFFKISQSNYLPVIAGSALAFNLFLDQTEAKPDGLKKFFGDWARPLSQGLDDRVPPSPPYLKVWIRHCITIYYSYYSSVPLKPLLAL